MKLAEAFKSAAKKRYIPPTYFGMLFAGLGDKDKAMMWLEKAFEDRADGLTWLNVEPMLDEVRSESALSRPDPQNWPDQLTSTSPTPSTLRVCLHLVLLLGRSRSRSP